MDDSILTRISLSGAVKASARLEESGGSTAVTLSIPGGSEGVYIIACGERGCETADVRSLRADVGQGGVCALALCRGGRVLAMGFTGSCRQSRARLADRMRILAAERNEAAPPPEANEKAPEKPADPIPRPRPGSAAEGIVEQARRLFGAPGEIGSGIAPENAPHEEAGAVPNPFPRTFPNSRWLKRPGEETLYGKIFAGGVLRSAAASPVSAKAGRALRSGSPGRVIRALDGRLYRLEIF